MFELACPASILDKERLSFLDDIEKGINYSKERGLE